MNPPSPRPRRVITGGRSAALLLLVCALAIFGTDCGSGPKGVRISGKTVYGPMAIEGARMEIVREGDSTNPEPLITESGYHGAFTAVLAPGSYRISAVYRLRRDGEEVALRGKMVLTVPGNTKRVDRVVVEMSLKER